MTQYDRMMELREQQIPRKDAAVAEVFKRWQGGEQDVLPLLTSMQQELSALQQELAVLESGRLQASQTEGVGVELNCSLCKATALTEPLGPGRL